MTLAEIAQFSEDDTRAHLEKLRWPNGPVCPHCESREVTRMKGKAHRKGAIQCNGCRQQFTVILGTVMESTRVPLRKWVMAFHLLCSSKKGYSALQLKRDLGLGSYKTAWFMAHRIRYAMNNGPLSEKLKGTVEMDETYVGGKPRHRGPHNKRGRGTKKKPVVALVERDGEVRSKAVENVKGKTLNAEILQHVDKRSTLMTDELPHYTHAGRFVGDHRVIRHNGREYVRREGLLLVTTNTVESYFALIKRGHYGVYHSMSRKHIGRYVDEFAFRWNHRKANDSERRDRAIQGGEGKRLMYAKTLSPNGLQKVHGKGKA